MYALVEEQVQLLERLINRVAHCEIVLSRPHLHHKKNRFHHVRIRLKLPNRDIIIDREVEKNSRHISFRLALQDAFHSLQRRLETEIDKMRGMIKHRRKRNLEIPTETALAETEDQFEYEYQT
jgi:ribosome-associated translation inhibitor RaiA